MKILHINTYDKGGGAEQFAFDFVHQQEIINDQPIDKRLFVKRKKTNSSKVEILERSFLSHVLEKTDKGLHKLIQYTLFSDWSVLRKIHGTYESLKQNSFYKQADIIHLHNIHYDFFDIEDLVQLTKEKPIIWTLHDMWAMTGGEAYTFENKNFIKGVGKTPYHKFHPLLNPIIDRRQAYLDKKRDIYHQISHKRLVFVPVSEWLADCLQQSYVYNSNLPIHTIQNGIDETTFFTKHQRTWIKPRILFFNSDNPYKGGTLFSELLATQHYDFDLVVVGKDTVYQGSKTFLKPIYDRKKLNELYNQVDIMVFPSRAENFSLLVLEAMAAGVCVLGSTAGGIVEQLANGRGFLFENDNQQDLTTQLDKLLQLPMSEIRAIGEKASAFVHQTWTQASMIDNYHKLYQKVLSTNH